MRKEYRYLGGAGATILIDGYNYTIKRTDVCGTLTENSRLGDCGAFAVAESIQQTAGGDGLTLTETFDNPYEIGMFADPPMTKEEIECIKAQIAVMKKRAQYRARRLTPKECWRLMGFDDKDYEAAAKVNSATQLFKQAGNSIVVQVLENIFKEML